MVIMLEIVHENLHRIIAVNEVEAVFDVDSPEARHAVPSEALAVGRCEYGCLLRLIKEVGSAVESTHAREDQHAKMHTPDSKTSAGQMRREGAQEHARLLVVYLVSLES